MASTITGRGLLSEGEYGVANETALAPAVSIGPIPGVQTFTIEPPGLGAALKISIAAPVQPVIGVGIEGDRLIVASRAGGGDDPDSSN